MLRTNNFVDAGVTDESLGACDAVGTLQLRCRYLMFRVWPDQAGGRSLESGGRSMRPMARSVVELEPRKAAGLIRHVRTSSGLFDGAVLGGPRR